MRRDIVIHKGSELRIQRKRERERNYRDTPSHSHKPYRLSPQHTAEWTVDTVQQCSSPQSSDLGTKSSAKAMGVVGG